MPYAQVCDDRTRLHRARPTQLYSSPRLLLLRPHLQVRSLHLLWYARSDWLLVLIPECTLMLLVVYYVLHRDQPDATGGAQVLVGPVELLGLGEHLLVHRDGGGEVSGVSGDVVATTQMAESPDDSYFNFQNVAAYAEMESTATAFSAVLTYLKVLAYLARVPRLNTLLATLGNAGPRLGSYLIILAVIWVAFASAFYLALGTQLDEWRSVRAIQFGAQFGAQFARRRNSSPFGARRAFGAQFSAQVASPPSRPGDALVRFSSTSAWARCSSTKCASRTRCSRPSCTSPSCCSSSSS